MRSNCFNNRKIKICLCILFTLLVWQTFNLPLYSRTFGKKILAIYKSSDGYKKSDNPIKWYFEPELKKLGLKVKYHDFDSSIPDRDSLSGVRAIVTFYLNSIVNSKEKAIKYINFLDGAVNSGIKLIIINSFGAYGYKENGVEKWDLADKYINPLYKKLGFDFKGYWTDDPKKLRIVYKNSSMVEWKGKQNIKKSKHYQLILPLSPDVTSHLMIKRIDKVKGMGKGISSVILTSSKGGFALEQYVFHNRKFLLNPAEFIRSSLFYDEGYQNIGVIAGNIKERKALLKNIRYSFEYAKLEYSLLNPKELASMVYSDLLQYEALLIAADTVDNIPVSLIKNYINAGGSVVFLKYADLNEDFKKLLGIKSYDSVPEYFKEGFTINPDFFMNRIPVEGKNIDTNVKRAELTGVKVLAKAGRSSSFPVLWEKSYGKGKILYWNTDLLMDGKRFRGTIIQSIHHVYKGLVTGLANIAMMMIDDFPAPYWNTYYKKYRLQYYQKQLANSNDRENINRLKKIIARLKQYPNISDTNFIRDVWIKDIIYFQKKLKFKYTTYLIFNYSTETGFKGTEDEFSIRDFYLANDELSVKMGKLILKHGWELGLHGYNHMSMTLKRPKEYHSEPWPDERSMIKALTLANKEWKKIFKPANLPFSYVAPHNIIDTTGMSALGKTFPTIRALSALYMGRSGESEQEFGWSKDNRFFLIPRMTSGYSMDFSDKYTLYDVVHNFGVISHFIHPDDVFDQYRSYNFSGWQWMKKRFINDFSKVNRYLPWIRWMTVKDAFSEFIFYKSTNIRVKRSGKTILIKSSDGSDRYLFFRLSLKPGARIIKQKNCKAVYSNKRSGDYIFKTNSPLSEIRLR